MTPEQYKQVGQLYHAALELAPDERAAFLDSVSGGDQGLRREVEALLQAREQAGNYFAAPALEVAAEKLARQKSFALVGRTINHYRILSLLGTGGMGEVYSARDTRLSRAVAIKILPQEFSQDAERLRRFAQEARAVSTLNHPNIITVFDIGEVDGAPYFATELVDGQTLRQRMRSALGLRDALEIAVQVAHALAAAHEAGVIHRDIKPENVMLRHDGIVKVLDFGLAKLTEKTILQEMPNNPHLTDPGKVMGTPHYMSPEQARGVEVDARTDLFSLGCVLYEMVTGRVPFEGRTSNEVLAAILALEPLSLAHDSRSVPTEMERIIAKALAKNCKDRYQDAKNLLIDLKNLKLELEFGARLKRVGPAEIQNRTTHVDSLLAEETTTASFPQPSSHSTLRREILEPVGGAVPLESKFYIVRPTDEKFRAALARQDSIVLVKGARQVGKTSLLARGLQQAREAGANVVLTDFQNLSSNELQSFETLLLSFATSFVDQLDLDSSPQQAWKADRSPGINFEQFLRREVLLKIATPVVWGLDEVDRLFTCGFGSEVFGLFRSWHNKRALDPAGPWRRLTLAIAYATEAHLFITDLNQSPFNVGTRLQLDDFDFAQVTELNRRYDSPLHSPAEVTRFFRLVGGHPYLVRRGLHELVDNGLTLAALEAKADHDEGPFGDHLRRIFVSLTQDPLLADVVRSVLQGRPCPTAESFYRLRSAGLVSGDAASEARLRCQLYASYLEQHLL